VPIFKCSGVSKLIHEYCKLSQRLETVWYASSLAPDGYIVADKHEFGFTEGDAEFHKEIFGETWATYMQFGLHTDFEDFNTFVLETLGHSQLNEGEGGGWGCMGAHDEACVEEVLFLFGNHTKKDIRRIRSYARKQCGSSFLYGTSADAWWVLVCSGDGCDPPQWGGSHREMAVMRRVCMHTTAD